MSRVDISMATIDMATYIDSYRNVEYFMEFCKACHCFGQRWSCPPFDQPIEIEHYRYATIIGAKVWTGEQKKGTSKEELFRATKELLEPTRHTIEQRLLSIEGSSSAPSRVLFGGSCKACGDEGCTRTQGKACSKPHLMRPSLEALGFDLGRTASELLGIELQWGDSSGLPQYYTLLFGWLTLEQPSTEALALIQNDLEQIK